MSLDRPAGYAGTPESGNSYTEARMFDGDHAPFALLWTNGTDGCGLEPLWETGEGCPDKARYSEILLQLRAHWSRGALAQEAFEAVLRRFPGVIRRPTS